MEMMNDGEYFVIQLRLAKKKDFLAEKKRTESKIIFKQNAPKSCIFSLPAEWCSLKGENFFKNALHLVLIFVYSHPFNQKKEAKPEIPSNTRIRISTRRNPREHIIPFWIF
ncbi:MAG: hypothetical protein LBD75_06060 [Candidatus Peribacteria bacterium]|jgi:hypothetical protein|nr:hypothetical protein [Candidatus Peribacteria bacterium]